MYPTPVRPNALLLPVSILAGILFGTCVFLAAKVNHPPPVDSLDIEFWDLLGTQVPEVELMNLDGDPISSRPFKGQGHVLFFGQPGCAACDEVYPALKEAAGKIPVLMVYQQGLDEVIAKVNEQGFAFPVAYDSLDVLVDPLHVTGYPTAMFVSAAGQIVKAASGNIWTVEVMRLAVASITKEE